jgi:hypothetical protein
VPAGRPGGPLPLDAQLSRCVAQRAAMAGHRVDVRAPAAGVRKSAAAGSTRTLARSVPGGVETKVVSPAIRKLLTDLNIAFAREVKFELLDTNGQPVLRGYFDIVFRDPSTMDLIVLELKGDAWSAVTPGQTVYLPQFMSEEGATMRVVSRKGGKLYLPSGAVVHLPGKRFLRVAQEDLTTFTRMVGEMASGKPVTNVYYSAKEGLQAYHSQAEFERARPKDIAPRKAPRTPKVPAGDKPLRPPKPPDKPLPNPLYDPPARKPKPPTGGDPISGSPHPELSGPAHPPAKPAAAPAATGGGGVTAVEHAAEGAVEAAGKGKLSARLASKGAGLLAHLVPDPIDMALLPFELFGNYFGSYARAAENIRERNLTHGFALGWAAYLVIPRWEWAREFGYTVVDRNVVALVLGTVGVAENAHNEGLKRGFRYGKQHSTAQAESVRHKVFNALVQSGHTPGRYDGDDLYTFGRDDVYLFAGVLEPAARAVLAEGERLRKERAHMEYMRRIDGTSLSRPL